MLKDAFRTIQKCVDVVFEFWNDFRQFLPLCKQHFSFNFVFFDWLDGIFQSNRVSMFVVGSEKNLTQKTNYKKTVINLKLQ